MDPEEQERASSDKVQEALRNVNEAIQAYLIAMEWLDSNEVMGDWAATVHCQSIEPDGEDGYVHLQYPASLPAHSELGLYKVGMSNALRGQDE